MTIVERDLTLFLFKDKKNLQTIVPVRVIVSITIEPSRKDKRLFHY